MKRKPLRVHLEVGDNEDLNAVRDLVALTELPTGLFKRDFERLLAQWPEDDDGRRVLICGGPLGGRWATLVDEEDET